MKKSLFAIVLVLGFSSAVFAGDWPFSSYTDWAYVAPAEPTTLESIDIVVGGSSSNAIFIEGTPWTVTDNVVEVVLEIGELVLPVITEWEETITIGMLPAGDYQVLIYEDVGGLDCVPFGCDSVAASTSFTVVPEPAGLAVLLVGSLFGIRRR